MHTLTHFMYACPSIHIIRCTVRLPHVKFPWYRSDLVGTKGYLCMHLCMLQLLNITDTCTRRNIRRNKITATPSGPRKAILRDSSKLQSKVNDAPSRTTPLPPPGPTPTSPPLRHQQQRCPRQDPFPPSAAALPPPGPTPIPHRQQQRCPVHHYHCCPLAWAAWAGNGRASCCRNRGRGGRGGFVHFVKNNDNYHFHYRKFR